ncbi:MAG: peptide chain release factor N(5)-glutamine methyltransferase [Treponema sp.]|nr:peptide chain release factor N(5)-glutamine methyltransferase [Treponema sp.]
MTLHTARREGITELAASPTAALDASVLLAHCIGREKSYVLAHRDEELSPAHYSAFTDALRLRKTGLPVAYITGHKEFYALDFLVTKDVLIPKPDTELLVELALAEIMRRGGTSTQRTDEQSQQTEKQRAKHIINISEHAAGRAALARLAHARCSACPTTQTDRRALGGAFHEMPLLENADSSSEDNSPNVALQQPRRPLQRGLGGISLPHADYAKTTASAAMLRIVDVCTGSGCVGISISRELAARGIAHTLTLTDISASALEVAQQNAARLLPNEQLSRTAFAHGDLLHAVPDNAQFDIIVANPPYVPHDEVDILLQDGRSEPRLALDGDAAAHDARAISEAATLPESSECMRSVHITTLPAARKSDGLAVMRRLVPLAYAHLADGGAFFVESGEYNASQTAELLRAAGFAAVATHCDLAGLPRVTVGYAEHQ